MIFRGETRGEIVTRPDVSLSDCAAARISATLCLFLELMSISGTVCLNKQEEITSIQIIHKSE